MTRTHAPSRTGFFPQRLITLPACLLALSLTSPLAALAAKRADKGPDKSAIQRASVPAPSLALRRVWRRPASSRSTP